MKVISLVQPFATLVVIGAKRIETRCWDTKFRGPLLIHASLGKHYGKGPNKISCRELCYQDPFKQFIDGAAFDKLPFGAIIGKVNLVGTCETECVSDVNAQRNFMLQGGYKNMKGNIILTRQEHSFGDYSLDRYGWMFSDPAEFIIPTPAKGSLSLWDFDETILIK